MKRLTKEQIELIRQKRKEGFTYKEIAQLIGFSKPCVYYWCCTPKKRKEIGKRSIIRFKNLSPDKKKEFYMSRREYNRIYHNEKYKNNPNFRKKQKESSRRYNERKRRLNI